MTRMRRTAICIVCCLATVRVAMAQHVQTDFDHKANFSQYKTYSWQAIKADPLWDTRIRNAVDAELAAKGWTRVETGGDVSVMAIEMTRTQRRLETFYNGFGGGWGWRGFGGFGEAVTTPVEYKVGTLVVDMFDTRTKQLIWRGSAEDTLSDKPEKNETKLEKSVAKMFKTFPPRPTS